MKKFTIFDVIVLSLFSIVFYVLYIVNKRDKKQYFNDINKNRAFAVGKITGYGEGRWSHGVRYSFIDSNGINMHSSSTLGFKIKNENRNRLKNQLFPVIYSKRNTKNNEILIFELDFKEWGISYPDSLKWINNVYY